MPSARAIKTTMLKKGIPEDTLNQFVLPDPASKGAQWSEEYIAFFDQMDRLLTEEQRLSIMEQQGCCVSGKPAAEMDVSPTFCGCCGGHARQNLQRALGVKLRLKKIVSSAASSKGKQGCEFLFEIL